MALAVGILLSAIGAVTAFAWNPGHNSTYGIDVHGAGVILLVFGIAGVVLGLVSMYSVPDRERATRRTTETEVGGSRATRRDLLSRV